MHAHMQTCHFSREACSRTVERSGVPVTLYAARYTALSPAMHVDLSDAAVQAASLDWAARGVGARSDPCRLRVQ